MIKTVVIDCDGVLTNGKVQYDSKGERSKDFFSRDIRAIRELVAHGFDVIIYTQSSWPGMEHYAARTGATVVMNREKIPPQTPYIAIGDDTPDIEMLNNAQRAFCPANADPMVRSLHGITVLESKGGEGCIAEMLHHEILATHTCVEPFNRVKESIIGIADGFTKIESAAKALGLPAELLGNDHSVQDR